MQQSLAQGQTVSLFWGHLMLDLLQRVSAFLLHVIDSPEVSDDTREAAIELDRDVVDAINEIPTDPQPDNHTRGEE